MQPDPKKQLYKRCKYEDKMNVFPYTLGIK